MITADLTGKRTLVTGAASGIGLAAAEVFARCGAAVAMNDLPGKPGYDDAVSSLQAKGLPVRAAPGNVGDRAECRTMVQGAITALGGLDHLVNNAGTPATTRPISPSDLDALEPEVWNAVLSVNLLGPFWCAQAAADTLKASRGAIVNTCSIAGFIGVGSSNAYAASKAGLIALTKGLAKGLAPAVRVNAVAPGAVDSPWMCRWPEADRVKRIAGIPLGRVGLPTDYAEAILFLAAGAAYVTGQTLVVDGGQTA